jgi:hypothetical protein
MVSQRLAKQQLSRTAKSFAIQQTKKAQRENVGIEEGFLACEQTNHQHKKKEIQTILQALAHWECVYPYKHTASFPLHDTDTTHKQQPEHRLFLNRNYERDKIDLENADWVPWVVVKQSTIGPDAGNGLFAARRFCTDDTIGVYMGSPPPPIDEDDDDHAKHPYVLHGVADAGGGVGTKYLPHLGLHFMNDPTIYLEPGVEPVHKLNAEFLTLGRVRATRRIYPGEEIFAKYEIVKEPQTAQV